MGVLTGMASAFECLHRDTLAAPDMIVFCVAIMKHELAYGAYYGCLGPTAARRDEFEYVIRHGDDALAMLLPRKI